MTFPKYISTGQLESAKTLSAAAQELFMLIEKKPDEAVLSGLSYRSGHSPSVVAELLTELFDADLITVNDANVR